MNAKDCIITLDSTELGKKIKYKLGLNQGLARVYVALANSKEFKDAVPNFKNMSIDEQYDAINTYYETHVPDVNNSVSKEYTETEGTNIFSKEKFASVSDRRRAIKNAANEFQRIYVSSITDHNFKNKTANGIFKAYFDRMVKPNANASKNGEILKIYFALKKLHANDDEFNAWMKELDGKAMTTYEKIIETLNPTEEKYKKFTTVSDNYYGALLYDLIKNYDNFKNEVFRDSRLQILNRDFINQDQKAEQEGVLEDKDFDGSIAYNIDEEDHYLQQLNSTLGDYVNAMKHIDSFIRAYFNSLPKLRSTAKKSNGEYDYLDDNVSGIADTMDAEDCVAALYHYADSIDVVSFVDSIRRMAETNPEYASLIILYDALNKDEHMRNFFYVTFAQGLVSKFQITNKNDSYFRAHRSNELTDSKRALKFRIYNTFKELFKFPTISTVRDNLQNVEGYLVGSNIVFNDINNGKPVGNYNQELVRLQANKRALLNAKTEEEQNKLKKRIEVGEKIIHRMQDEIYKKLHEALLEFSPIITNTALSAYLMAKDDNVFFDRASALKDVLITLQAKSQQTSNQWLSRNANIRSNYSKLYRLNEESRQFEDIDEKELNKRIEEIKTNLKNAYKSDYMASGSLEAAEKLAEMFNEYITVSTELNSTNVEGNMSSDVISNNMISNLMHTLNDSNPNAKNAGDTPLFNYGRYKLQTSQYKYSNILIEHTEGGKIYPGLFTYNDTLKMYIPTAYAKNIITRLLFDGAKNMDTEAAALYASMSKQDYRAAEFISFMFPPAEAIMNGNKKISDAAVYFLRTQSDKPKTFGFGMPRYNTDRLRTISSTELNRIKNRSKEIFGKINSIPITDKTITLSDGNVVNIPSSAKKYTQDDVDLVTNHLTKNNLYSINIGTGNPAFIKTFGDDRGLMKVTYTEGNNTFSYLLQGNIQTVNGIKKFNNPSIVAIFGTYDQLPKVLKDHIFDEHKREMDRKNDVTYVINTKDSSFNLLRRMFFGELQTMAIAIKNMFELEFAEEKTINGKTKKFYRIKRSFDENDIDNAGKPILKSTIEENMLYDLYHGVRDKKGNLQIVEKNEKGVWHLLGKVFTSDKFTVFNEKDKNPYRNYGQQIIDAFFNLDYKLNGNNQEVLISYDENSNDVDMYVSEEANKFIDEKLSEYLNDFARDTNARTEDLARTLNNKILATPENFLNFALNYTIAYNNFSELFEGDTKFYKDAQDLLKRVQEVQAGGRPYAFINYNKNFNEGIKVLDATQHPYNSNPTVEVSWDHNGEHKSRPVVLRDGFQAITIFNTIRVTEFGKKLKWLLSAKDSPIKDSEGRPIMSEARAAEFSQYFSDPTKTNDAQSYITFEEWVRRIIAKGQYPRYKDLIDKISKGQETFNAEDLDAFVQVQKNTYYDQWYDPTTGHFVPRYIKNSELVLIPQFIKGTDLEQVYNMMMEHGIDQLNTAETSKAGKKGLITIWDNDGNIAKEGSKEWEQVEKNAVKYAQPYWYNYLYTQQETAQHVDATNKLGIQIAKKAFDNIPDEGHELSPIKKRFFEIYNAKINQSFDKLSRFIDALQKDGTLKIETIDTGVQETDEYGEGIVDENGKPVNKKRYKLNYNKKELYALLYNEAKRLGVNSNELDYFTLDDNGNPLMPSDFPTFATRFESIVQSLINSRVVRQTLPGFHAAQITGVGFGGKYAGRVKTDKSSSYRGNPLQYRPMNGKGGIEAYMEVVIPRPKALEGFTDEEIFAVGEDGKNMLERAGIDTFIGYRIPTEGKFSMALMKIVGFVDRAQGSTIIVPDEWVAQTGSDFDIDSIYAAMFNFSVNVHTDKKTGKTIRSIYKPKYNNGVSKKAILARYGAYIKSAIKDLDNNEITYSDIKKEIKRRIKALNKSKDDEIKQYYADLSKEFHASAKEESDLYHKLPKEERDIADRHFATIDTKGNSKTYKDRIISFLNEARALDNKSDTMIEYISLYEDRLKTYDKYEAATVDALENFDDNQLATLQSTLEEQASILGLKSFDDFSRTPVEEQQSNSALDNEIVNCLVAVAKSNTSIEEMTGTSHFKGPNSIVEARDEMYEGTTIGLRRKTRSAYNVWDQSDMQEEVISGRSLKAISVSRDTFASVSNTAHAQLARGFTAIYEEGQGITKENIESAFDIEDPISINGRTLYKVEHKNIGWSKNNRNVIGEYITTYTAQTTAHHLDAVKEGGIPNLNTFTFGVYKTLSDAGTDFRTSVRFIMQPAVALIVEAFDKSNSIFNKDSNSAPIVNAIKSLAMKNGLRVNNNYVNYFTKIDDIFSAMDMQLGDAATNILENELGFSHNDAVNFRFGFNDDVAATIPISRKLLYDRFKNTGIFAPNHENYENNQIAFDAIVLMQYHNLSGIAENINNYMQVLNPDKFGAKQTLYSTYKVFDDIKLLTKRNDIICADTGKNLLSAIYPGVEDGLENYVLNPTNTSKYPPLNAMLKRSTAFSCLLGRELFSTQSDAFREKILDIFAYVDKYHKTEEVYNDFKKYVLAESMMLDTKYDSDEIERVFGYSSDIDFEFKVNDLFNPTEEEKNIFAKLTPAQKVVFINKHWRDPGIFKYINVNTFNRYKTKGTISSQDIRINYDKTNIETLFDEFRKSFWNDNYFMREAAKDLVNYVKIVENYGFGKYNISKIITTDVLRFLDIPEMVNMSDNDRLNALLETDRVYTNYIRSHRDVVPTINNIRSTNKSGGFELNIKNTDLSKGVIILTDLDNEESPGRKTGLVTYNEETEKLEALPYVNIKTDKITRLYKAIQDLKTGTIYYIPLSYLEANEHGEWSANIDNITVRYAEPYYDMVVNDLMNNIKTHAAASDELRYEKSVGEKRKKTGKYFEFNEENALNLYTNAINKLYDTVDKIFTENPASQPYYTLNRPLDEIFRQQGGNKAEITNININGVHYIVKRAGRQKSLNVLGGESISSLVSYYKKNGADKFKHKYGDKLNKNVTDLVRVLAGYDVATTNSLLGQVFVIQPEIELAKFETDDEFKTNDEEELPYSTAEEYLNTSLSYIRADKYKNQQNADLLSEMSYIGINTYKKESIAQNLTTATRLYKNFILNRISDIEKNISDFNGLGLAIDNEDFVKRLNDDENLRTDYLKFLNDYYDFINKYGNAYEIENSDDVSINHNFDEINEAINKIRNNIHLEKANNVIVTKYLQNLSTDPLNQAEILDITDAYHNIGAFASFITDTKETGIPVMQLIVNEVMSHIDRETMIGREDARNWTIAHKQRIAAAKASGQSFNWHNIIRNGKFITPYNDDLIEELNKRQKALHDIKQSKPGSVDYYRAVIDYNDWINEHFEQELVKDYYTESLRLDRNFITAFPEYYAKYKNLQEEIRQLSRQTVDGKLSQENINKIAELGHNIAVMRRLTSDEDGLIIKKHLKEGVNRNDSYEAAIALRQYAADKTNLERKYFIKEDKSGIDEEIKYFQDIVERYEVRDKDGNLLKTTEELNAIPEYVSARNWLELNTTLEVLDEIAKPVAEAYKALYAASEKELNIIDTIKEAANAKDEFGIIDGRKFSENQIKAIKAAQELQYRRLAATKSVQLLRNRPSGDLVYNSLLNDAFVKGFVTEKYNKVVEQINEILERCKVVTDGITRYKTSNLSIEELQKLYALYNELSNTRKETKVTIKGKEVTKKEKLPKFDYYMRPEEKAALIEEENEVKQKGSYYYNLWYLVNYEEITVDKLTDKKELVPRRALWQMSKPADCTLKISKNENGDITFTGNAGIYVDLKKTLAKTLLKERTYYTTTPYYEQVKAEMKSKSEEEYNAWFEANHVKNIDGQYEPLKIWMMRRYKAAKLESAMAGAIKDSGYKRTAKKKKLVSTPVEKYKNLKFNSKFKNERNNYKLYSNYRSGTGYDNNIVQSQIEKEVQEDLMLLFGKLVKTGAGIRFLDKGYVPAKAKGPEIDAKWWGKNIAGTFGLYVNGHNPEFTADSEIEYGKDIIPEMPFMSILKGKATKSYKDLRKPIKENFNTEEEYNKALDEYNEQRRAITEHNEQVHASMIDEDWDKVIPMFIERATRYNAIQQEKQLLYYGLNWLKNSTSYADVLGKHNIPKNERRSSDSQNYHQRDSYDNAVKMMKTLIRRLVYNQYKQDQGKWTTVGNLLQSHSSAKFMMLNVTGGISNVTYGETQIFGEWIAKDYIGPKDYLKGSHIYNSKIYTYFADMFSEKASSLQSGIMKLMQVVDFDKVNNLVDTGISGAFKEARDLLYGLNSGGEHMMQNKVMFSMMLSHKLFRGSDIYGDTSVTAQTLEMHKRKATDDAMEQLFAKHPELKDLKEKYITLLKSRPSLMRELAFRRKYIETDFFDSLLRGKSGDERKAIHALQREYIELRKAREKELEAEWKKADDLYSQFELKDGYAVFKENSILGQMDRREAYQVIAKFKEKVQDVNKKIHGVYDKIGAARMEEQWYGGLIMQYKKHLYPGFMKRFRVQGYYNESRQTVEKGSYIALYDFLAKPFKETARELREQGYSISDEQITTMESVQRYFSVAKDYLLNIKTNWNMLPDSERANIRRSLSDIAGFTAAVLAATAARLIADDDDKDNILYNLAIYSSDRLATESLLYIMPWAEAKVLWRNPIAAQTFIGDILSVMNLASQALIQGDDFNPNYVSGVYKGENKAKVLTMRQIPIYRALNQVYSLYKKNTYFKLTSNYNQDIAENIANWIKGNSLFNAD